MRIRSLVSVSVSSLTLVIAASLLSAGSLAAQSPSPAMSPSAAAPQWRSFLGANPLGIPFDIVSVEAETAVSTGGTIGALASYNDIDNKRYQTIDARFKYYPGEIAMQGFAMGLSLGYTKFTSELATQPIPSPTTPARGELKATTLGVLIDYNWAQGPTQRFVVGTGVGAKRILAAKDKREAIGLDRAYVTARFVVGLLF